MAIVIVVAKRCAGSPATTVVVVKNGNATAHRLHDVALLWTAAGKAEINACGLRDVDKRNRICGRVFFLRSGRRCWGSASLSTRAMWKNNSQQERARCQS